MTKRRGHGEGSIVQRKSADRLWMAQFRDVTGKRRAIYGKTRVQVAGKLTTALKAVQDGLTPTSDRETVESFGEKWLAGLATSVRPTSLSTYGFLLRGHVFPALGTQKLGRVQPQELQALYAARLEAGASPQTVRHVHGVVRNMYGAAVRWGMVVRNPAQMVSAPRVPARELPMLSPGQVSHFLAGCRGHRLEALFTCALMTGARSGELLGAAWDVVDLDSGVLEVRVILQESEQGYKLTEPKTRRSHRVIALPLAAVEALRRHRARQAEEAMRLGPAWRNEWNLVFTNEAGGPVDRHVMLARAYRPLLRKAGLPVSLTFHDLRHVFASTALAKGLPVTAVAEALGHSTPATTMRRYAHALPNSNRQVAAAIQAAFAAG